jgi:hypothetical protein
MTEVIINAFEQDREHRRFLERTCFSPTSAVQFWIAEEDEGASRRVRLQYLARRNALEVRNDACREIEVLAIDNCLFREGQKCDAMLIGENNGRTEFHWIELKMEATTDRTRNLESVLFGPGGATDQILATLRKFKEKAIPVETYANRAFIGISDKHLKMAAKSNETQKQQRAFQKSMRREFATKSGFQLSLGPILKF